MIKGLVLTVLCAFSVWLFAAGLPLALIAMGKYHGTH